MGKLIKHLKPFVWWILAIFVLLFGQAMADLSLPGYMANIVNIGIGQKGIENAVPEVVSAAEFQKITLFIVDNQQQTEVKGDYLLLSKQSLLPADYARYVKDYPQLANTDIYKLNTTDKNEITKLDAIFVKVLPPVFTLEQDPAGVFAKFGITLPSGADPFQILRQLQQTQPATITTMLSATEAQINATPTTLLKGASVAYISAQYTSLGMNIGSIQNRYMFKIGELMLLLTLASACASITVGFISARIAAGLGRNMRKQLFVRVESFSNTEFDKFSTASLVTRSTNDITQIQMLMVMLFRIVFYAPIIGVGGILKVIHADTSMLWIIAAAVGTILTMMLVIFTIALPKFKSMQKLIDKLNLVTREILTGLMVIRAFNKQKHEEGRFDLANQDLTKTSLFVNRIMVFMMPAVMLLMNVVMILIIWVGAHQVDKGSMQVGDMMAFMQYAMQIIFSFLMVTIVFVMLPRASVSAVRISEVLETEPVINDPEKPQKFSNGLKGTVEFQDVAFRYPGAEDDVLKHLTFTARPGQTTAFIGSTGSGKTTLINLIPRFYDVTGGKVLVDGVDVRNVTQHDLREKIGYVSQKAVLFSGTIESNIRYANENATKEEIAKYTETAQALDIVNESAQGYDTPVSQGGTNLSGGQKQRLAIARALAKKPEIYIFDDSLSALDFKTDMSLRKALKKETSDATVLIVTQRVSTIMGAEQIVVMDNGEVSGIGTHRELMNTCKVYQEIALSQLSKEELDS
jgi:ATP-binding cassette, subfamily B, multidrug efflux pump